MFCYLQAVQYIQEIKSKRNGKPRVQVLDENDTPENVSEFRTPTIGFNLEKNSRMKRYIYQLLTKITKRVKINK